MEFLSFDFEGHSTDYLSLSSLWTLDCLHSIAVLSQHFIPITVMAMKWEVCGVVLT